jgi:hypothetical protein
MCPSSSRSPAMPLMPLPATPIRLILRGGLSRISKACFVLSASISSFLQSFSYSSSSSSSKSCFALARQNHPQIDPDRNLASSALRIPPPLEDGDDYEGRVPILIHLLPLPAVSTSLQISAAASLVAKRRMLFESSSRRAGFANNCPIRLATLSPFADSESINSAADAC